MLPDQPKYLTARGDQAPTDYTEGLEPGERGVRLAPSSISSR